MKKILFLFFVIFKVFSQAGSFDATFDFDGKAVYCFPPGISHNNLDAGFQSNGKIICYVVNYTSANGASLIRWNVDGSLDTTFGVNGFVYFTNSYPFNSNQSYYPSQMAIQPDNKIIIMGLQQGSIYPNAFWIARLLPDGTLDSTFNGTGYLDFNFGTVYDRGICVALQADGKILVGGTSGSQNENFCVARLTSSGVLDSTFGVGGKVLSAFSNGNQSWANSIAIQSDGKIILGGFNYNVSSAGDFAMIRYNSDGSVDTNFGVNGRVTTSINTTYSDIITKIVIQADGKIIAGGRTSSETNPKMAMVRYLPNGVVDTTFGTNGKVIVDNGYGRSCSIALQIDGKIIMGGGFNAAIFEVYRYNNNNGTLDTSFGDIGFVDGFPGMGECANTVLIQPDNKIVVCGSTNSNDFNQGCLAAIRIDPGTLGIDEISNNNIDVYPNPTSGIVSFDNSKLLFNNVTIYNQLGQEVLKPILLSQNPNETLDVSSLSSGIYIFKFNGDAVTEFKRVIKN